jgi:hypothetical protein
MRDMDLTALRAKHPEVRPSPIEKLLPGLALVLVKKIEKRKA